MGLHWAVSPSHTTTHTHSALSTQSPLSALAGEERGGERSRCELENTFVDFRRPPGSQVHSVGLQARRALWVSNPSDLGRVRGDDWPPQVYLGRVLPGPI